MGKTPKSKNANYQPTVVLHRPKNVGTGKLSFPGISEKSDPKRRMKLIGSFSRKPSHGKSFSMKVTSSSIAEQSTEIKKISRMSAVAAEASESLVSNYQSDVVLENGEEDSRVIADEMCFKDKPITNGSEPESTKLPKSDAGDDIEILSNQAKEINPTQEQIVDGESTSAIKLSSDDDGESKKQRAGTPQSRSSTPQRKSERVRTKHGSPIKSIPSSSLTPGLKVLKINLTPARNVTNGTMETKPKVETEISKSKGKTAEVESQKTVDGISSNESGMSDILTASVQDDKLPEKETPNLQSLEDNAPYLRSLRLVSGRRSLTSHSPCHSMSVSSTSGSITSTSQWKKRQSRKKDGIHSTEDSESEYQDNENEYYNSANGGKRKSERVDDQAILFAGSIAKKPKNEEDEINLYLPDENEEEACPGNSDDYLNRSQQSKSTEDEFAYLKDLNDSSTTDENVKDESMEYAYEAREIEGSEKFHDCPAENNQSSNKRWCILM